MSKFNTKYLLLGGFLILAASSFAQDEFLDPEIAFVLSVDQADAQLQVHWDITPGYKLYRDKIEWDMPGLDQSSIHLPDAEIYYDENFEEDMAVYHSPIDVTVPLPELGAANIISITYQGCADAGLCYPPIAKQYTVLPGFRGTLSRNDAAESNNLFGAVQSEPTLANTNSAANKNASQVQDESSIATRMLQTRNLWTIAAGFFLFGLLLSFTPCVLPMVPILFSIIVGMKGAAEAKRAQGFRLALTYSLGMALVYTSLGISAGMLGEGLAAYLQAPWILAGFAGLLVLFSLSMFDVYQLQMPASLQTKLDSFTDNFRGGQILSVFIIGAVSALIVGPCVAAPLAGALIYISQTGDVVLGGVALFCMAMGMSIPLLLTGLSAGSLLPRAGEWMNQLKVFFGLLLLAVAIWMLNPVLPGTVLLFLWGALAILSAMYLGIFDGPAQTNNFRTRFTGMLAMCLLLIGLAEVIGAVSGSEDPLQPLAFNANASTSSPARESTNFRRVANMAELQDVLANTERPVMLDFYADWCVSCKEMERFTFSDPEVESLMGSFTLLQADVTENNLQDRELLKAFNLFGPPGIILFDSQGQQGARVIGFTPADNFISSLSPFLN